MCARRFEVEDLASFIGLEVAASLRERGLEVVVVGKGAIPLEKVLGPEFGKFIQDLHEQHGVRFSLGSTPKPLKRIALNSATDKQLTPR